MWILETPIKSKKEWRRIWLAAEMLCGLHPVCGYGRTCTPFWFVCVMLGAAGHRGCAWALHPPVHVHMLSTPGLGIICFIQMGSSHEPAQCYKDELSR